MRIIRNTYVRGARLSELNKSCKRTGELELANIFEMNTANTAISENALGDDMTLEQYVKISQRQAKGNRTTALRINSIGPVHRCTDSTKKAREYKR